MKCPACAKTLSVQTVAEVTLDVCAAGCGGIWFDQFEFKKFDEKKEPDAEAILNLTAANPLTANTRDQHDCPKCQNIKMMRHFSSPKRKVVMDECPKCAGVWLDAGELTQIKDEFASDAERSASVDKLFLEMFGSQVISEKLKSKAQVDKAQAFANALRFVCPSYYIKGKQEGGAF